MAQTKKIESVRVVQKRRIAISLTDDEQRTVEIVAKRFAMKDAAFCAYCVKYYLSHFGDDTDLKRLAFEQPRLL